ncbi:hypothetical protein ATCC90586_011579 [Pythium insidiosum]|nr:hypothetical protein ATCC90586_011579 [Pythium insidiosum]
MHTSAPDTPIDAGQMLQNFAQAVSQMIQTMAEQNSAMLATAIEEVRQAHAAQAARHDGPREVKVEGLSMPTYHGRPDESVEEFFFRARLFMEGKNIDYVAPQNQARLANLKDGAASWYHHRVIIDNNPVHTLLDFQAALEHDIASKKESFADMAFDGDKRAFAAWKDVIIGHLRQLSSQRAVDDLTAGRDPPALTYEEMLVQSVNLTSPGDEASDEEKKKYRLQQAMLKQQELYIKNLFNRTLPKPYRSQMTVSLNDQKVNAIWRQLEADYGQSSAQGMVEMVQEFEHALSLDFQNVTQLFQRLKGIRNRVNRHAAEAVQRQLIPSHLMMVKVLSLLPSQFWGSAVTFTPEEFTLEKLEEKMRNIFGDKSKAQILAMTKTVPVNHVKGKAKPVNHVKSQAHMRGSGKRKFAPEPEINNGQCFY